MLLVKLDATDSTNQYLKELLLSKELDDFTVVSTKKQLKGKGQMGAVWESEPGKNLTISILKKFDDFSVANQFLLNICASLAILDTLESFKVPRLSVKWPNDILSGNSKICGILIENILSGYQIHASIIGIGLNINQMAFNTSSNASSLKLLLGRDFDHDTVLQLILKNLQIRFSKLIENYSNDSWKVYESHLFRKDKPSTFKSPDGKCFMGFIRNVSRDGKLVVELEDSVIKDFDLKEIQLLY